MTAPPFHHFRSESAKAEFQALYLEMAKAAVKRLNRLAPQIRTEIIPGAGHDLTLVQAALVAERVLAFLGATTR